MRDGVSNLEQSGRKDTGGGNGTAPKAEYSHNMLCYKENGLINHSFENEYKLYKIEILSAINCSNQL